MYTIFSYSDSLDNTFARISIMATEFYTQAQCFSHISTIVSKKLQDIMKSSTETDLNLFRFKTEMDSEHSIKCVWGYRESNKWINEVRYFSVVEIRRLLNTDNVELSNDEQKEKSLMRNKIVQYFNQKDHKTDTLFQQIVVDDINSSDLRTCQLKKVMVKGDKTMTLFKTTTGEFFVADINHWSYRMLKDFYKTLV